MTNDLSLLKSWPESQTIANDLRSRILAGKSFHNCYLGLGSVWQVKLFLGGEQRIVAQARNSNLERAIRFADMAIAYFAPYRKRRNRPLLDSDFNLNVNQANADLHNIPEAVKFLQTLESELLAQNKIARNSQSLAGPKSILQLRRSLGLHLHLYLGDIESAETLLGERGRGLIGSARDWLGYLQKCNTALDAALSEIPNTTNELKP